MGAVTLHRSASAAARLDAAHRFVEGLPAASEALVVGASRDAVDDFVRDNAARRGAAFGLHRFSLRRLATRIAEPSLAARGLAPATRLGAEAVAARAAFEAARPAADEAGSGGLGYLAPIAKLRSFGRTLASTLEDVRAGGVAADALSACDPVGADLDALSREYGRQLAEARLVDLPELYRLAAAVVEAREPVDLPLDVPVVLLDVPVHDRAALGLVAALAGRATRLLATVPRGDDRSWAALSGLPHAEAAAPAADAAAPDTPLARVRNRLFEPIATPDPKDAGSAGAGVSFRSAPGESRREDAGADVSSAPGEEPIAAAEAEDAGSVGDEVSFFSAPGESRECVEIARLVQKEAARGVPLDRMAVVLRSPQVYSGLLETALRRAGVEAWFVRGTRAPDPAGRAFLALLACAAEQLSARRFSEYLSLGQVPEPDPEGAPPVDRARWVPPAEAEQVLPAAALPVQGSLFDVADLDPDHDDPDPGAPPDADDRPVVGGTLRAPWHWDRLLVESAVIGGGEGRHEAERGAGVHRHVEQHHRHVEGQVDRLPGLDHRRGQSVQLGKIDETGPRRAAARTRATARRGRPPPGRTPTAHRPRPRPRGRPRGSTPGSGRSCAASRSARGTRARRSPPRRRRGGRPRRRRGRRPPRPRGGWRGRARGRRGSALRCGSRAGAG